MKLKAISVEGYGVMDVLCIMSAEPELAQREVIRNTNGLCDERKSDFYPI